MLHASADTAAPARKAAWAVPGCIPGSRTISVEQALARLDHSVEGLDTTADFSFGKVVVRGFGAMAILTCTDSFPAHCVGPLVLISSRRKIGPDDERWLRIAGTEASPIGCGGAQAFGGRPSTLHCTPAVVGQPVEVRGTLRYSAGEGYRLDADAICRR